jgi:hypothetical protein
MDWVRIGAAALLGATLTAAPKPDAGDAIDIGVKDRANANASLATSGAFVGIAWAARTTDGVTDIYAATSRDAGRSFVTPVQVNTVAGEASVSGEQPPRIVLVPRVGGEPVITVVWTAKSAAGTRLVSARSGDGGRSFTPPQPVPGSDAAGNRGWQSVATTRQGEVVALWLDHRDVPARTAGSTSRTGKHDHHAADGAARAQLSRLFFGRLDEPDSARAIAGGVCYCCKTSIAAGSNGGVYAAWRHVFAGNVRDIAFTRSSDGGRAFAAPIRVSEDNWVLDGCPENGPALTVDDANRIHVAWTTLIPGTSPGDEPTLALFYAMSRDGTAFTPRQRIPTQGSPRHPDITIGSAGEILAAWDEQANGGRRVAMARGHIDGAVTPRFVRESVRDDGPAVYPVVSPLRDGAIMAWVSGFAGHTTLRVQRLSNKR